MLYTFFSSTSSLFPIIIFFAAASPTLYYHFEPKFYVNFRQSEVFLNCNIHHTSLKTMPPLVNTQTDHTILL